MEMLGNPICMRPQCHVDLLRTFELRHDRRGLLEYGAEFSCLSRKQIGDVDDVAPGLDDQRPYPERTDAVVDKPRIRRVNAAAGCGRRPD